MLLLFAGFIRGLSAVLLWIVCAPFKRVFSNHHTTPNSLLRQIGSIQLNIHAPGAHDNSAIPSMMPVVFKTAVGAVTVQMSSKASMIDIQQRFAKEICSGARLSQAPKRHRVSKAMAAAAAAKMASEIVITCNGRVLREGTLADACWSAGATVVASAPLAGGMLNCLPTWMRRATGGTQARRAPESEPARPPAPQQTVSVALEVGFPVEIHHAQAQAQDPVSAGASAGGRRGRSFFREGGERLVREIAQEAAASSEAWRKATDGGKRVTSHNLRSAFMNRVDPNSPSATEEVFPGQAPFHPNDR